MLPKTTEYALRAMSYLATLPEDTVGTSAELAAKTNIPRHYVSKLMRRLVVAGLVVSQRGHGGGFILRRAPEDIRFIQILEAVNFPNEIGSCVFGWETCSNDNPCPLHPMWAKLRTSFLDWAQETRLSQVRDGVTPPMPSSDS